jgi:hypothetical protein
MIFGVCKSVESVEDTSLCVSVMCRVKRVSSVAGYSPVSNDVGREAGKSPLLRTVTSKRLVKTD